MTEIFHKAVPEVPQQIFGKFLAELQNAGVSVSVYRQLSGRGRFQTLV